MSKQTGSLHRSIALSAFSVLWACAILFHLISTLEFPNTLVKNFQSPGALVQALLFLSALLVLLKPNSLKLLASLCLLHVVDVVIQLPSLPNHWLFGGIISAAILTTVFNSRYEARDRRSIIFAKLSPIIRTCTCLLYIFVAIIKLNTGFLNPEISCATVFYRHAASWLPLPDTLLVLQTVIWGTIIIELLLPLMLLIRPLRPWALLLGTLFHIGLALDIKKHFFDFSSVMIAALFASTAGENAIQDTAVRSKLFERSFMAIRFIVFLGAIISLAFALNPNAKFFWAYYFFRYAIWVLFAIAVLLAFVAYATGKQEQSYRRVGFSLAAFIFPALIIINGLGPYLGYRTRGGWQMYSNVRIEPEYSNHLFVSKSANLTGYLGDTVEIVDFDDWKFELKVAPAGKQIPEYSVDQYLRENPGKGVVFRKGEQRFEAVGALSESERSIKQKLLNKYLWFHPTGPGSEELCFW